MQHGVHAVSADFTAFPADMTLAQRFTSRAGLVLLVVATCMAVDQIIKQWALNTLPGRPAQYYFDGLVTLIYAENPGVAFSMGSELSDSMRFWIFTIGVTVFLLSLLVYVMTSSHVRRVEVWAYSLVIGGGASNVLDRMMHEGIVVDYIVMGKGMLRTAIFNLADTIILVGLGILLVYSFVGHRTHPDETSDEADLDNPAAEAEANADDHAAVIDALRSEAEALTAANASPTPDAQEVVQEIVDDDQSEADETTTPSNPSPHA